MNSVLRGNLVGLGALLMWSTMLGLIRATTEAFGVAAGTALIYSVGATAIFLKSGLAKLRLMPKIYVYGVGAVFVAYEIIFSQAVGMAESASQALEIGMLNNLWPSLTVVFSIWINKTKLRWWVWPGTLLSLAGLYWCVSSNSGLELAGFIHNLRANPVPYLLGTVGGATWALYSNLSFRYSEGFNAIPLFFAVIAAVLWLGFFLRGGELHFPGWWAVAQLLLVGAVMGFSYSMWESGIHQGNFILLAVCSYFNPAASMLFASLWLKVMPGLGYWAGVGLVTAGSLLCWLASLKRKQILTR